MKTNILHSCVFLLLVGFVASVQAVTVTLDLNGFVSAGGTVSGEGIEEPVAIPPTEKTIKLENLQAGMRYRVDFAHNSGDDSSDFDFTINRSGTGVAEVSLGGGRHTMLTDFQAGATTLKLATFTVTFNPDKTQTGSYAIAGMTQGKVAANASPVVAKLIPGKYTVQFFGGPHGADVFEFIVDSQGKTSASGSADEYVTFADSSVKPRVAKVHFKIVASMPIEYNVSHQISAATTTTENVNEFDMLVPVGGGGVTVTTFGRSHVAASNVVLPDGQPLQGSQGDDEVTFNPRLCFDARRGFFFETMRGPTTTVTAHITGQMKDKQTEITAKFSATIVPAKPPTTQPTATTKPSATPRTPSRPGPTSVSRPGVQAPSH